MGFPHKAKKRSLRSSTRGALAILVACSWTSTGSAQSLDQRFEEGFELNPIEPAPAGDRFFLVPGGFSDPDAPSTAGPLRGTILLHYSHNASLTRTDNDTGETADIVENQLYAHANVTAHLLPWLMLNADLPFAVMQRGQGAAAPGTALGDLRMGARFGLFGKRSSAFAISPGVDVWLPSGSPDNLTGDESARAEPYVSIGGQADVLVYAAKAGVQARKSVFTGSLEVGTSMTYGLGAGFSLFRDSFQIGPELSGRTLLNPTASADFDGSTSVMTGALGARVQLGDFNIGAAFGVGLTEAPGTAPRTMLSFSYNPVKQRSEPNKVNLPPEEVPQEKPLEPAEFVAEPEKQPAQPRPLDSDNDGIADSVDACPQTKGESSASLELNGCPREKAPPTPEPMPRPVAPAPTPVDPKHDTDGDGIADWEDSCLYTKGIRRGDNDARNGCPKESAGPKSPLKSRSSKPPSADASPTFNKAGPPTATWVGFRSVSPTTAVITVKLTKSVPIQKKTVGKTVTYTIKRTRVRIKNNENPLLAAHFGSVVESAQLKPSGKDLKLVIQLKKSARATHRLVESSNGPTLRVELVTKQK